MFRKDHCFRLGFEQRIGWWHDLNFGHAIGKAQRCLKRVGEATFDTGATHETVDDHLDGVVFIAREIGGETIRQFDDLTVDACSLETLAREFFEQPFVFPFAAAHYWR